MCHIAAAIRPPGSALCREYPTLHELAEQLPDATGESQFEAGLNALLRGFKARKPRRSA